MAKFAQAVFYLIGGVSMLDSCSAQFSPLLAEFPDREEVPSANVTIDYSIYMNKEWAKSWNGPLPDELTRGRHDGGLGHTQGITNLNVQYAVDKILRIEADRQRYLTILDVGTGSGYVASRLCSVPKWTCIGVDQSSTSIEAAEEWLKAHASADQARQISFKVGAASSLPLEDASVNVVVAFNVLEQISNLKTALAEFSRVLAPDGVLVFGTMNRSWRSRLNLLWHTEMLKNVPKEAFDWRLGILPSEMKSYAEKTGLNVVHEEFQGICESTRYEIAWDLAPWVIQPHLEHFQACDDTSVRYQGWAYKKPVAADDDDVGEGPGTEEGVEMEAEKTDTVEVETQREESGSAVADEEAKEL